MNKAEARSAVMGAISMALKDSTLQQGFEVICKNLAELEMTVGTLRTFSNEQATCIERLEKENEELKEINADLKQSLDWANEREREDVKRITELEAQISNLLSCKNCPENKGGYICQKEYEDKCLAQKIQYIKELKEENADIKEKRDYYKDMADTANKVYNENLDYSWYLEGQLTQSKDLLKKLCDETCGYINDQGFDIKILAEAEHFLKE